jgi:hypothetical protein
MIMTVQLRKDAIEKAYEMLPDHMAQALIEYFELGRPIGDFLRAVLANDLVGTFARADRINKPIIGKYIEWLYWYPPGRPFGWGSYEAIDEWIEAAAEARHAKDA